MTPRLAPAGMLAGGALWAGALLLDAAGAGFPAPVFAVAVLLVGLSLPWTVRPVPRAARGQRIAAAAGVAAVLSGLAATLLFNLQLVLLLADWIGVGVSDQAMDAGRRGMAGLVAIGLLTLAASRGRAAGEGGDADGGRAAGGGSAAVVVLVLGGVAGLAVAALHPHRLFFTWYLGLAVVWILLGAQARQARRLPAP